MPFFIADPEWRGRSRDGIPGQSLIHRPIMEGSDCSSSDDEDDEVDENPDPNRLSKMSYSNPHTAVKEYHRCQIEEIIVAIKDFDTYAARSYYADLGVPGHLDIYPEIEGSPWTIHDSISTAVFTESQAASSSQSEAVNPENQIDRQFTGSHVLCGRNLTPPSPQTETSTNVTLRSERYPTTNSTISDFVPEWPATTQGFSTLPSYRRRSVVAKEPSEEPKLKTGFISAARKFFTERWTKRLPQPDTEAPAENHILRRSGSSSSKATSTTNVYADPNFLNISLH